MRVICQRLLQLALRLDKAAPPPSGATELPHACRIFDPQGSSEVVYLMDALSTPDLVEAFMDHVDVNFLFAAALSCKAFGAARAALAARDREKAARPSAPKEPSTAYSFYLADRQAHSRPPPSLFNGGASMMSDEHKLEVRRRIERFAAASGRLALLAEGRPSRRWPRRTRSVT